MTATGGACRYLELLWLPLARQTHRFLVARLGGKRQVLAFSSCNLFVRSDPKPEQAPQLPEGPTKKPLSSTELSFTLAVLVRFVV